ncbi:hypothetical protein [Nonomuraea lactucae]|uniref:hypothetical protein n=1 Tax=Nonomuraea lactucae TaxID=2249762 RepID=UPI000DE2ABF1|nr:hypothetical protein [Nonomuraea lactucae]
MKIRPIWQKAFGLGLVAGLAVLSFVNAGVFSFITALVAWIIGALLGVVVGAEGGRRDNARRIEMLEQQYEHALQTARTAVHGHTEIAGRLYRAEEDLRAAHADQARLRAQLDELDQPDELSELVELDQPAAEAQPQP